jgi:hypothetical protein
MGRVGGASNKAILLLTDVSKDGWRRSLERSAIGDVVLFAAIVVLILCWERW